MALSPLAPGSRRVPSLDGLRAVSILLVVIGHGRHTVHFDSGFTSNLLNLFGNASLGVSIFYVISGFLITELLLGEVERYGTISLKRFYVRRAFRILPAYYFFLLVMGILAFAGILNLSWRSILSAAFFTTNYGLDGSWWLGHSWSLCVEEQFYLLWPLTLVLLGPRRCFWLALGVIVFSPVVRVASYFLFPAWRGNIGMMFHTRADQLMLGCIAALSFGSTRFQSFMDKLFRYRIHWVSTLFIFCISPLLGGRFHGGYTLSAGYSLEGLGITIVMLWAVRNSESLPGKILNSRPAICLGVLSYSLYLWQQPFLTPINTTVSGIFPWNVLCAFMLATFSYVAVERTFLRWREMIGLRGKSRTITAGSDHSQTVDAVRTLPNQGVPSLSGQPCQ